MEAVRSTSVVRSRVDRNFNNFLGKQYKRVVASKCSHPNYTIMEKFNVRPSREGDFDDLLVAYRCAHCLAEYSFGEWKGGLTEETI